MQRKNAELIKEAKELESKNLISLGKKTVEFLNGKCQLNDLETLAIELDLFDKTNDDSDKE